MLSSELSCLYRGGRERGERVEGGGRERGEGVEGEEGGGREGGGEVVEGALGTRERQAQTRC